MTRRRMDHSDRHQQLLDAAMVMALDSHYMQVSIRGLATFVGVSHPLIFHYFGSHYGLQTDILRAAQKRGINRILAQAIVAADPRLRVSKAERKKILDSVT